MVKSRAADAKSSTESTFVFHLRNCGTESTSRFQKKRSLTNAAGSPLTSVRWKTGP
jgi:hypothetical protein